MGKTAASVNGLAYVPNNLSREELHRLLIKAYLSFYLRPRKVVSLLRQLRSVADVKRYLLGGQQIAQQLIGSRSPAA